MYILFLKLFLFLNLLLLLNFFLLWFLFNGLLILLLFLNFFRLGLNFLGGGILFFYLFLLFFFIFLRGLLFILGKVFLLFILLGEGFIGFYFDFGGWIELFGLLRLGLFKFWLWWELNMGWLKFISILLLFLLGLNDLGGWRDVRGLRLWCLREVGF